MKTREDIKLVISTKSHKIQTLHSYYKMNNSFKTIHFPSLLIGILIIFVVFGFNYPFLPKLQISLIFPKTTTASNNIYDFLTAIGTIGAVFVAIWGSSIKKCFYMSEIEITDFFANVQFYANPKSSNEIAQGHTRLLFRNNGNDVANNVEVYISKILDNDKVRDNFLPVPLSWTHDGKSKRNFNPKQYGYLDLIRRNNIETESCKPKLVLVAGQGVENYENISEGNSKLFLDIFQENGMLIKYQVDIEWTANSPCARVINIQKI